MSTTVTNLTTAKIISRIGDGRDVVKLAVRIDMSYQQKN